MSTVIHNKINNSPNNATTPVNNTPQTALIKTAAGALYKVNASALQGKTVGQQIIIKTSGSGATTTATIVSINPATPTVINKPVTSSAVASSNSTSTPGTIIRSVGASNASPNVTPGQRIQIIRPVTPVTMTTNSNITSVMASPLTTQIRLSLPNASPAASANAAATTTTTTTTTTSTTATSSTPSTTANTALQHFVQIPIRLPDGRTQTINLPVSLIQGNQPVQIALNQTAGGPIITVRPRFTAPVSTTASQPPTTSVVASTASISSTCTVSTATTTTTASTSTTQVTPASKITSPVKVDSNTPATVKTVTLTPNISSGKTIVAAAASSSSKSPSNVTSSNVTAATATATTTTTTTTTTATVTPIKSSRNSIAQVKRESSLTNSSTCKDDTGPPVKKVKLFKTANENLSNEVCALKKEIKDKQVLLEKQLFKDAQYSLENHRASKISINNDSLSQVTNYGDCKMDVDDDTEVSKNQLDHHHEEIIAHEEEVVEENENLLVEETSTVNNEDDIISTNNSTNDHKTESNEELYCVCRQPYDETQVYVGCDACEGWFHCSCVNITPSQAETMDKYFCPSCEKK